MARFHRLLPSLVMAITLTLGVVGTVIADVEVVRAATTTASAVDATDAYVSTSGPSGAIAVPGYPY